MKDRGCAMSMATLKEKGQITVPANIRRQIQAHKGVDIGKYIGSMKGQFGSVEEIDAYIRNERDSWN